MDYDQLINNCKSVNNSNWRVLVLGAGFIAKEYCKAISCLGITDVMIVARTEKSARECAAPYGFKYLFGGYNKADWDPACYDLAIIALPMHELKPAAGYLMERGVKSILVEKPGSLYSSELKKWAKEVESSDVSIRIAYNRLLYPNLLKLKELSEADGGITSCRYTFTEWIHTINFGKEEKAVYERWGVSNSLHVISMAHFMIGLPKEISTFRYGSLPWHPSGSRFVGSGITEKDIPFSYHADWDSAGRWGIEIMTKKNAYQLSPLEELYRCQKGSVKWERVEFERAYPHVKQGIAEEIMVMLQPDMDKRLELPDLRKAFDWTKLAEDIFGYESCLHIYRPGGTAQ